MTQVMATEPGQFGLAWIVRNQVGTNRKDLGSGGEPHVAREEVHLERLAVAVEYQAVGPLSELISMLPELCNE